MIPDGHVQKSSFNGLFTLREENSQTCGTPPPLERHPLLVNVLKQVANRFLREQLIFPIFHPAQQVFLSKGGKDADSNKNLRWEHTTINSILQPYKTPWARLFILNLLGPPVFSTIPSWGNAL